MKSSNTSMRYKKQLQICAGCLALIIMTGCCNTTGRAVHNQWIQATLFFGLSKPDGTQVSQAVWQQFVDNHITPRFPDGMTVIYADGQYRDSQGHTQREPSRVVMILYERKNHADADDKLDLIAKEYARQFEQMSVLIAHSPAGVRFVGQ